jgi:hypothetical protein
LKKEEEEEEEEEDSNLLCDDLRYNAYQYIYMTG